MSSLTSALEGVRVVQLDDTVAAAVAGMVLADFGADVVMAHKRERGGMEARSPGFAMWDRNKRIAVWPSEDQDWPDTLLMDTDVCILTHETAALGLSRQYSRMVVACLPPTRGHAWAGGQESSELLVSCAVSSPDK